MKDPYSRSARKARLRLVAAGAAAGALIAGLGAVALSGLGASEGGGGSAGPGSSADGGSGGAESPGRSAEEMTPALGNKVSLAEPEGQKHGMPVGWPRGGDGAISAAVAIRENLDPLDDDRVRGQMEAVTSKHSLASVDRAVSQVRATREYAGLPPSGAAPPGFFVTTTVKAVRLRTLPTEDDTLVQEVWMVYDRHGPGSGGGPDKNPLTDQMDSIVLVWEDGDWKLTEEYDSLKNYPIVPYDPDSPKAWQHGWWQVDR